MGLLPIEFTDCLTDSPYFRENLHAHERELDRTSIQIKGLIREVKDLLSAAKVLSRAQRNLANTLSKFEFQCIGGSQTDDEIVIAGSLKEFGRLLSAIEDERERMFERAEGSFIEPIEKFRREHIGGAKEQKKKFDKETARFCQSVERHLSLSTKKSENHLQEADASLAMEQRHFIQASLEYVHKLQEVQERKKFEFVETILTFMYGWLTFYHQGHEVAKDFRSFMTDLQIRLQRTRHNYDETHNETEMLLRKMLEIRKTKPQDPGTLNKMYSRQGYLFLMEKKAFGTTWVKTFCQYQKENRRFTMIPYNQTVGKISTTETIILKECIRRMSDSIDKRFCFDVVAVDKPNVYTFQALSETDRKLWLDAMDGKDPLQLPNSNSGSALKPLPNAKQEECFLDDLGFAFVRKCIEIIEARGLEDQGLYRVGGVSSKVSRLIQSAFDRQKHGNGNAFVFDFENPDEWEIRTITSALKNFFRNLPDPLMTFRLHHAFIAAAKQENKIKRIDDIHALVHRLPKPNFEMLHLLILHLKKVAENSDKNLMPVNNLGVCLGPSLLRPEEESVAAIMDTKFANVVVEILIENCDKIFNTKPNENSNTRRSPTSDSLNTAHKEPRPHPIASITPTYDPHLSQNNSQQIPFYGRVQPTYAESAGNVSTYATVPTRRAESASQVYRSGSHDQLSQTQHIQLRSRPSYPQAMTYQQDLTYTHHQSAPLYQSGGGIGINDLQSRPPFRPIAVYNPWNNQSSVAQFQPVDNNHSVKRQSPVNSASSGSGDSLPNHNSYPGQQSPRSSPVSNSIVPSFFTSNSSNNSRQSQNNQQSVRNTSPSNTTSPSTIGSTNPAGQGRKVRTLYACVGENDTELSFEPNVIISNVRPSREPGWLEGFYNGRIGLIPQNYVQFIE